MSKKVKVRKLDLVDIEPKNNSDVVWLKSGNTSVLTDKNFMKINKKGNKNNDGK